MLNEHVPETASRSNGNGSKRSDMESSAIIVRTPSTASCRMDAAPQSVLTLLGPSLTSTHISPDIHTVCAYVLLGPTIRPTALCLSALGTRITSTLATFTRSWDPPHAHPRCVRALGTRPHVHPYFVSYPYLRSTTTQKLRGGIPHPLLLT